LFHVVFPPILVSYYCPTNFVLFHIMLQFFNRSYGSYMIYSFLWQLYDINIFPLFIRSIPMAAIWYSRLLWQLYDIVVLWQLYDIVVPFYFQFYDRSFGSYMIKSSDRQLYDIVVRISHQFFDRSYQKIFRSFLWYQFSDRPYGRYMI